MIVKDRDTLIDSIAGFLILIMVAGHCKVIGFDQYSIGQVFGFYMGWFFYKAGLFHKEKQITIVLIKNWVRRLIVPFISFSLIGLIVALLCNQFGRYNYSMIKFIKDILFLGTPMCNSPIWFLLSLFCVRIITIYFSKSSFFWLFAFCLVVAILHETFMPYYRFVYVGNISLGVVCYIIGAVIGRKKLNNVVFIVLCTVYVLAFIFFPSCLNFFRNHTFYGPYLASIALILPGILIINEIFARLKILRNQVFAYMGRNSLPILVLHYPIWLIIREIDVDFLGGGIPIVIPIAIYEIGKKYRAIRYLFGEV